jgi:hypothetical protein
VLLHVYTITKAHKKTEPVIVLKFITKGRQDKVNLKLNETVAVKGLTLISLSI